MTENNASVQTSSTSTASASTRPPRTDGFKSVLIREEAFQALRNIQLADRSAIRFDLKDIATAALNLVLQLDDGPQLVMDQAKKELKSRL